MPDSFRWHYRLHDEARRNRRVTFSVAAIELPVPTAIRRLRVLLHTRPPKNCKIQGSTDTTDGVDGS